MFFNIISLNLDADKVETFLKEVLIYVYSIVNNH